jgi:hypothetical protein
VTLTHHDDYDASLARNAVLTTLAVIASVVAAMAAIVVAFFQYSLNQEVARPDIEGYGMLVTLVFRWIAAVIAGLVASAAIGLWPWRFRNGWTAGAAVG